MRPIANTPSSGTGPHGPTDTTRDVLNMLPGSASALTIPGAQNAPSTPSLAPQMPALPHANPGGIYSPDVTASNTSTT